jgi:23S rRNA (uridine2552-2'-O)-methyltransferase
MVLNRVTKPKAKDPRRVADHYTRKARAQHYPARSVFKLEEVDRRFGLLGSGQRVLDLGCAPGSWTMYAAQKVGPSGFVLGIDIDPVPGIWGPPVRIRTADVRELSAETLAENGPFDVVLSDMAPRTTGQRGVDQARSADLARTALALAEKVLRPGGSFLYKIFMGPEEEDLMAAVSALFRTATRVKPRSSRSFSSEIFGLGMGLKRR